MELQGSEFLISHAYTFQRKRYISIAHTGMYALGPFFAEKIPYNYIKIL